MRLKGNYWGGRYPKPALKVFQCFSIFFSVSMSLANFHIIATLSHVFFLTRDLAYRPHMTSPMLADSCHSCTHSFCFSHCLWHEDGSRIWHYDACLVNNLAAPHSFPFAYLCICQLLPDISQEFSIWMWNYVSHEHREEQQKKRPIFI